MSVSIADLPVVDDMNVPYDPEEYQDQLAPAPVKPGNYRFMVTKVKVKTDQAGNVVLQDGRYPTLTIEQVKIVEPTENERLVNVFTDIKTKPFVRKGPHGDKPANEVYDYLRAFDASATWENFEEAKQLLQQHIDQQSTFVGQIGWTGFDKVYVEQQFAALAAGGTTREAAPKEVVNEIYAKARKATKDFVRNGVLQTSIVGLSGEVIEARPKLSRVFSTSSKEFEKAVNQMGPFKK